VNTPTGKASPAPQPRGPLRLAAAALLGLALLAYAWWADPDGGALYLPCSFRALTGWYCPGCGGQRALHALLHFRLAEALRANALAVLVVLPAGLALLLAYARECLRGPAPGPPRRLSRWVTTFLLLAALFGVVRNLPFPPFLFLRP